MQMPKRGGVGLRCCTCADIHEDDSRESQSAHGRERALVLYGRTERDTQKPRDPLNRPPPRAPRGAAPPTPPLQALFNAIGELRNP